MNKENMLTGRAIMRAEPLGQLVTRLWNPSATYSGLDHTYFSVTQCISKLVHFWNLMSSVFCILSMFSMFCSRHDRMETLNLSSHCTSFFLGTIFEEKDVKMIKRVALFYIFWIIQTFLIALQSLKSEERSPPFPRE